MQKTYEFSRDTKQNVLLGPMIKWQIYYYNGGMILEGEVAEW